MSKKSRGAKNEPHREVIPFEEIDALCRTVEEETQEEDSLKELVSRIGGAIQFEHGDMLTCLENADPSEVDDSGREQLLRLQERLFAVADRIDATTRDQVNEDVGFITALLDALGKLTFRSWRKDLAERTTACKRLDEIFQRWDTNDAPPAGADELQVLARELRTLLEGLSWGAETDNQDPALRKLATLIQVLRARGLGRMDTALRQALRDVNQTLEGLGVESDRSA